MNDTTDASLLRPAEQPQGQAQAPAAYPIPMDRIAELYNQEIFTAETAEAARQRIHWMCGEAAGDTVLDIGCSQGIATVLLAREGMTVTGLDSHPEAMAYARASSARETPVVQARITWVEADLWELPATQKFDTILLGEVIEHQAAPARFLAKVAQHLKPQGRIVLTTPFGLHPHEDHKVSLFPSDLARIARECKLHARDLEVTDNYMRTVLELAAEGEAGGPDPDTLLGMTEKGTLASQALLFGRLEDYGDKLRKRTELAKTQQKRAETAEKNAKALAEADQARTSELAKLRKSLATQVALAETRAAEIAKLTAVESARKKLEQRVKELEPFQAAARTTAERVGELEKRQSDGAAKLAAAEAAQRKLEARVKELDKLLAAATQKAAAAGKLEEALKEATAELAALRSTHGEKMAQLKLEHRQALTALHRASAQEREAARDQIKRHLTYRWGSTLVAIKDQPVKAFTLPWDLYHTYQDYRASRGDPYAERGRKTLPSAKPKSAAAGAVAVAATANPVAKPVTPKVAAKRADKPQRDAAAAVAPRKSVLAKPAPRPADLLARAQADGVDVAVADLIGSLAKLDNRERAQVLLKASQAVNAPGNEALVYATASAAVQASREEPTLRALFWAAQKARRFDVACDTILELEDLVGPNPTPVLQERLDRLRRSPANQLRVLKLIQPAGPARIQTVPRRVCYVLHNSLPYSSGGYGTRSHGVAGGLKQAGFDVVVLTRPGFPLDIKPDLDAADVPDSDTIDGIRYMRTLQPLRSGKTLLQYVTAAADMLEMRLRELQPELVIAASNHLTALPALIAARRLGLHFVYEVRGLWEVTRLSRDNAFEETPAFAVQKLLESAVASNADHVFTLTEPMREELLARGVVPGRVDLLPNSCDPERFQPRPRDEALAAQLGLPPGVPVIGYVGTFVDYEGLEDLASACALLKARGTEFRLVLVGNENASGQDRGPITEAIAAIASQSGFADWLVMPGRVPHDEVESYYSVLDICPFPRKPWPVCEMVSPMKPLEALAMEKAVLVSSVRALVEMIQAGKTGAVFEKGSIESMADELQRLITDDAGRAALGRNGREWVKQERTWERIGQVADGILRERFGASVR